MMKSGFKYILAWSIATLIGGGLSLFFSTQNVIGRLGKIGADIRLSDRIAMSLYDLTHGGIFIGFIALAFAVAFLVSGFVSRYTSVPRPLTYAIAGAVAMIVMLFLMKQVFFGVDIMGGARDMIGKFMQMLAGAIGGYGFARLTRQKTKHDVWA